MSAIPTLTTCDRPCTAANHPTDMLHSAGAGADSGNRRFLVCY